MWTGWKEAMNTYLILMAKDHLENVEKEGRMTAGLISRRWIPTFRRNILPLFSG
jgi:hypothetical protein